MADMTNIENMTHDKIIVCISNQDWIADYSDFNLSFDDSEEVILERLQSGIEEKFQVSIKDRSGWLYKIRKSVGSNNIYIIPNSTAG